MVLTLEEANRIARGTMAKAKELDLKINVAVCYSGGRSQSTVPPGNRSAG